MKLAFSIAARFLKAGKMQTFLIILGIAIGVSVQIFIGSLIQGLQFDLVDTTIGSQSQITITSKADDKLLDDYQALLTEVEGLHQGLMYLNPVAQGQTLLSHEGENFSIILRGMDPERAEGIYKFAERMVDGHLPSQEGEVMIGRELAEEAGLQPGDQITLLGDKRTETSALISGIFDLKAANLNKTWIISKLESAQQIFAYGQKVSSIEMQVEEVFLADTIAATLGTGLGDAYQVNNWKTDNAALLSGLEGQSISSYMIQIFVLISVMLGIASVLAITVIQKSKQIGILKAMGIRDRAASMIFMLQGLLLGIGGAIVGILLGLALSWSFTKFALNPDKSPIIPLVIDPLFITLSALVAVTVATLAALIPARKSSKLSPIEVIRNG